MNKFEMELNENKAKAFFVRHGEKVGLAVAAGLLGTFAYLGVGLKPDLQDRTPTSLESTVTTAENHIKNGKWEELRPHRLAIANTVEKLDSNKVQVAASDYVFDYLLARRSASAPLRSDPALLPVSNPETHVARMSIADTATDRHPLSMLATLDTEDPVLGGSGRTNGPTMEDGSNAKKAEPGVDLGAVMAATGIDPTKAGLKELANPAPVDRYVATVKYLFPFKQLYTDFRGAFRKSIGYDATNDRFVIRYLEIQRRVNGGEWVDYTGKIREQEKTYVVSAPDPFDDKYMNRVLTRPYPPVLLQDYYGVSRHTMIPEMELPVDPLLAESTPDSTAGRTGSSGRSGMSGMSGRSGPPSGMSGMSGPPSGMSGMSGMSGRSGMSGMSGRSGMSGASGQSGLSSVEVEEQLDLVDYKLVRFSDPTVEPGNQYEYRVRYWLYDPNNPIKMEGYVEAVATRKATVMSATASDAETQAEVEDDEDLETEIIQSKVKLDHLAPEVRERLALEAKLERPLPILKNCRPSPWSEPTSPVTVQSVLGEAFVSSATIPSMAKSPADNKVVNFSVREGAVRLVTTVWDSTFGIQVPLMLENVYPGSVLGGSSLTKVLDPITREYKKLENNDGSAVESGKPPGYKGTSGMVLVDFLGGREIENASASKTKFKVPTEALLLDSSGQLMVKSAVRDARDLTWLSGEVLREDGLVDKLAEADKASEEDEDGSGRGRSGAGGRSGRSGLPGGGGGSGPPPGAGGGSSGRSGRSGFGGGNNNGPPPGGGGSSSGRSGRPGSQ